MIGNQSFIRALKIYRFEKWSRRKTRPYIPKVTHMRFPIGLENHMKIGISSVFKKVTKRFYSWFDEQFNRWEKEWNIYHNSERKDSLESELELFIVSLDDQIQAIIESTDQGVSVTAYIDKIAESVLSFSSGELARQLKKFLGESFYGGTEWWDVVKKNWMAQVEKRITSSASDFLSSVRQLVYKAVQEDILYTEIVKRIHELGPRLTKTRASFLARDLIGSLHAEITKQMQLTLGIEFYTWQTQADEKVRGRPDGLYPKSIPSHWLMEGLICRWDDPTVYSLDLGVTWLPRTKKMEHVHPGQAYSCRCLARPFLGQIVEQVDDDLRGGVL